METEQIILWVIIGAILILLLSVLIVKFVKFTKMSKEEKTKILKTYLKGLVSLAEQEIVGTKKGQERLKMVEEYFKNNAPMVYKILLSLLGKENFQELVEEALKEVKESFEK